jgi:hypothetical protein
MTDINTLWEEALREARAEVIARHRVVMLHHDTTDRERSIIAAQSLDMAIRQLEALCEVGAITRDMEAMIDEAESRLVFLRIKARSKRSTIHLCGQFGRAT